MMTEGGKLDWPVALFALDAEGKATEWNQAMKDLSGYTYDDVVGKPLAMLGCCEGDSRHCELLCSNDEACQKQTRLRHSSGHWIPVYKQARSQRDSQGRLERVLVSLTNIEPLVTGAREQVEGIESAPKGLGRLRGESSLMRIVYERIQLSAASDANVLISGESGTGKELCAEAIHELSELSRGPLVRLNCSALSESILESELFGHVRGAFTGAHRDKKGRVEMARGGTLFLDEIGEISPIIQVKLLRVLQEKAIERVGDEVLRPVNFRLVAATHRNLREEVKKGRFREDLYYRLVVFPIEMPSLRDRKEDLRILLQHLLKTLNRKTGRKIKEIENEALRLLMAHQWPGNVRELRNALEHAFVTCQSETISVEDLPISLGRFRDNEIRVEPNRPELQELRPSSKESFDNYLQESGGSLSLMAKSLGVHRTTAWRWAKRWGGVVHLMVCA